MTHTTLNPRQVKKLRRILEAEQRQLLAVAGQATDPAALDDIALQVVNSRDTLRAMINGATTADYYESALISADTALKAALYTAGRKAAAARFPLSRRLIERRAFSRIDELTALVNALDGDMRRARLAEAVQAAADAAKAEPEIRTEPAPALDALPRLITEPAAGNASPAA